MISRNDPSLTSIRSSFCKKDGTWPWARQENLVARASCPQALGSVDFLGVASLAVAHPGTLCTSQRPSFLLHLLSVSLRLVNTFQPPSQYHLSPPCISQDLTAMSPLSPQSGFHPLVHTKAQLIPPGTTSPSNSMFRLKAWDQACEVFTSCVII